ncbi:protein HIRA/HIR1, partial [Paragonimus westermani]
KMKLLKPVWVSHGSLSKDNSLGRPIYSLDMHPDGTRLATGGLIDTCGVVILWNMAPIRNPKLEANANIPRKLFQMDSHQACVNCVRWSPTGRWLASAGMDKVVMLWKKTSSASRHTTVFGSKEQTTFTEHWRCSTVLRGHVGDIIDLAWSHDECRLASAGVDNSVIVWCRQTSPEVPTVSQFVMLTVLRANQGFVKGVAWDPVGRYLASQGDEISVKVWRTADWKEEAVIRKPFVKAVGQSQVMRMSWSLDGSTLAAPHAINNGFPTAKLIDRTNWVPAFDLVGHRKHVICARYCPNLFRKAEKGGTQTTADRRALVVIHDLFTNSVCDLTWSSSGTELMACSLDGTVSYMGFTDVELGSPWSTADLASSFFTAANVPVLNSTYGINPLQRSRNSPVQLHHKSYGQSLFDKLISTEAVGSSQDLPISVSVSSMDPKLHGGVNQTNLILETPEALALQQSRANVCQRLNEPLTDATSAQCQRPAPLGPSKQIETRGKDGRRRIIPKFLGHLDSLDEDANSNPQFTSSQSSQHNNRSASTPDDSCSSVISLKPSGQSNRVPESLKLNGTTDEQVRVGYDLQTQRDVIGQKSSLPSYSPSANGHTTGLACDPRTST